MITGFRGYTDDLKGRFQKSSKDQSSLSIVIYSREEVEELVKSAELSSGEQHILQTALTVWRSEPVAAQPVEP